MQPLVFDITSVKLENLGIIVNSLQFIDEWTIKPDHAYLLDKRDFGYIKGIKLTWESFHV